MYLIETAPLALLVARAKQEAKEDRTPKELKQIALEGVLIKPQGPTIEEIQRAYEEFYRR